LQKLGFEVTLSPLYSLGGCFESGALARRPSVLLSPPGAIKKLKEGKRIGFDVHQIITAVKKPGRK